MAQTPLSAALKSRQERLVVFVSSFMLTPKMLAILSVKKSCKLFQDSKLLLIDQQEDNYLLSRKLFSRFFHAVILITYTPQLLCSAPWLRAFGPLLLFSPSVKRNLSFILYFIQLRFIGFKLLKSHSNCSGLRDVLLIIFENNIQTKQSDLEMKAYIT